MIITWDNRLNFIRTPLSGKNKKLVERDKEELANVLLRSSRRAYHRRREKIVSGIMCLNKEETNVKCYLNCLKLKSGKKILLTPCQYNHSQDAQWWLISSTIRWLVLTQEHQFVVVVVAMVYEKILTLSSLEDLENKPSKYIPKNSRAENPKAKHFSKANSSLIRSCAFRTTTEARMSCKYASGSF